MIIGNLRRTWLHTAAIGMAACLLCIGTASQAAAQAPGADPGQATPAPPAPPPAAPAAPDPDKVTLNFFKGTEIGGLVDTYYDWYNTKADGAFRNFDTKHNMFSLSMAEIWLGKTPAADSRVGYKVRLNFGPAATNFINAAEPGGSTFQNIEEAYGSYLAPAGKGVQIDVGKFVTMMGNEVIESKDNWNYSRSLLFALAIPYYHAGVRVTYSPNDKVTLQAHLVNGWNNVQDNNTGKSIGGSITFKPTGALTIIENYMGGPEQTNDNSDWRNMSDTIVTYTATKQLSLAANYDHGQDTVAGKSVMWHGVAGYLKYQANDRFAVSPRVEWYNDRDGITTGTTQQLKEVTLTLETKAADNFLWRIEYRGDLSDVSAFKASDGTFKKNQQSISFGFLYSFSSKS
jgi:hypothetical protein